MSASLTMLSGSDGLKKNRSSSSSRSFTSSSSFHIVFSSEGSQTTACYSVHSECGGSGLVETVTMSGI